LFSIEDYRLCYLKEEERERIVTIHGSHGRYKKHKRIAREEGKRRTKNQRELSKNSTDTIFEPYETIGS